MSTRVRQSSRGIRIGSLTVQLFFAASILIGLTTPPEDQSASDQDLTPFAGAAAVCLLVLALRTLLLGVYLRPDEVVVRSWFRTYRIPNTPGTRFSSSPWSDFLFTEGVEYWRVQMISVSGPIARSFPATAVRRSRAIAQSELLNAYLAVDGATVETACDFARGESWRRERERSRHRAAARRLQGPHHLAE